MRLSSRWEAVASWSLGMLCDFSVERRKKGEESLRAYVEVAAASRAIDRCNRILCDGVVV